MRGFSKVVVAGALALLVSSPAFAQQRGRGFGFGGFNTGAALLMNESVQQELKLDSSQIEKARQLAQDLRERSRDRFQGLQDLGDDERRQRMLEIGRQIREETRTALKEILKEDQLKRFEQIDLQQQGLNAFASPEVADKLKLTEDQRAKVRAISEDLMAQLRDLRPEPGGDFAAAMQRINAARREASTKAVALLSADQKKTWEELTGKPFELVPQAPRRRDNN